ncbi:STAS domain-containing protein [Mycolicibacterium goodii]|uniref:STAS domain-containing protein n=1 Tax=Mycolicibacterium goodii TaxID=134601 RepID=A0ABS6HI50_MYCGD|nr:STAS domain-containing protein [Mycolicibacterium goodii]OKH72185.1 sulfate transporter [Mycobacterium sp. SWH-M5]MBU8810003.1 STAS domain-containing protein [Mycolicibacterium goodii]MBU8822041.1 STAS domain-containing protein [Mycolicibacterium goodii]MBU8828536.1 STAS domain-containing protein [Mycolicibacterium goodii]MBU8838821.1 STAS domain-containing protein [Mycolicibacterium goodii]
MPTISVAKRTNPHHGSHAHQRAHFTTRHLTASTVVVTVHGDLDASNAAHFTEYTLKSLPENARLILDLSDVGFFGAACFATLHTLNVRCAGARVDLLVVPGKAVSRVLRICDPDAGLITAPDVPSAMSRKGDQRPLQLVSENT